MCHVCYFKNKHKEIENIPGWTEEQINIILENILIKNVEILNRIVPLLKNKTLRDLVYLLSTDIIIPSKNQFVEVNCSYCGKIKLIQKYKYLKQNHWFCNQSCCSKYTNEHVLSMKNHEDQKNGIYIKCDYCGKTYYVNQSKLKRINKELKYHFCSKECKYKYLSENVTKKGKECKYYTRVECMCKTCGKTIFVQPNRLKKTNRFGEVNVFCSRKCANEYKKTYTGERSCTKSYYEDPDNKEKIKNNARMGQFAAVKNGTKLTKPHIKINEILENNNFGYENEKECMVYHLDIYLTDFNLFIEIMGDYYHASPLKYNGMDVLNQTQKNVVKNDKAKHTNIVKNKKINILYLWETDINKRSKLCEDLIKLYIKNDGKLENYHSFNYNDDLTLKENITYPYFEIKKESANT